MLRFTVESKSLVDCTRAELQLIPGFDVMYEIEDHITLRECIDSGQLVEIVFPTDLCGELALNLANHVLKRYRSRYKDPTYLEVEFQNFPSMDFVLQSGSDCKSLQPFDCEAKNGENLEYIYSFGKNKHFTRASAQRIVKTCMSDGIKGIINDVFYFKGKCNLGRLLNIAGSALTARAKADAHTPNKNYKYHITCCFNKNLRKSREFNALKNIVIHSIEDWQKRNSLVLNDSILAQMKEQDYLKNKKYARLNTFLASLGLCVAPDQTDPQPNYSREAVCAPKFWPSNLLG